MLPEVYELISEVMEDLALAKAIEEGQDSGAASKEAVLAMLKGAR